MQDWESDDDAMGQVNAQDLSGNRDTDIAGSRKELVTATGSAAKPPSRDNSSSAP